MKVLFVFSQKDAFAEKFVKDLKRYCAVFSIYINADKNLCLDNSIADYIFEPQENLCDCKDCPKLLNAADSIRETLQPLIKVFYPDVIHCNDAISFLPFRLEKNTFYSFHLRKKMTPLDFNLEKFALEKSTLSSFYPPKILPLVLELSTKASSVLIEKENRNSIKIHIYYYFLIMQKKSCCLLETSPHN